MHEQSRYAETKNASMIVYTSAIFIGIISNVENIKAVMIVDFSFLPPFREGVFKLFIILILLTLFISFIFSLLSFWPIINQNIVEGYDKNDFSNKGNNVLFFEKNTDFSSSEDLYAFYSKKYESLDLYNKDIANQILNLSRIADRKYSFFYKSVKTCAFGFMGSCSISFLVWIIMEVAV